MVVIQGNAFPDTHEEVVRAHDLKLVVIKYHDFPWSHYRSIYLCGCYRRTWENINNWIVITCHEW